jgi:hypothetical protein
VELNTLDRSGMIENDPDLLVALPSDPPAQPTLEIEGGFNREARIFGRDFDCNDVLKAQPSLFESWGFFQQRRVDN